MNIALIIAGGSGSRMGQDIPKQFINVHDKPVIVYTLEAFEHHPDIHAIGVVCISGWEIVLDAYVKQFNIAKLRHIIPSGATGMQSIRNGIDLLCSAYGEDAIVLIHDAIRPMVSARIISDCIQTTRMHGNAIVAIPCAEAMLCTEDHRVSSSIYPREKLLRTQTPQGFKLSSIKAAHERAESMGIVNSVASCTLMIETGEQVFFCKGSEKNIKLTTPDDIDIFKSLLSTKRDEWMKNHELE